MNNKVLQLKIEQARRLLAEYLPNSTSKPVLEHSIRVGEKLFKDGYSHEVVLAGFLHDILEDSDVTRQQLVEEFGEEVTELVAANTKDMKIVDAPARRKELILRCVAAGEPAAIIKAADIIDNYHYYSPISEVKGLDYCKANAATLLENMPTSFTDTIFTELKRIP